MANNTNREKERGRKRKRELDKIIKNKTTRILRGKDSNAKIQIKI